MGFRIFIRASPVILELAAAASIGKKLFSDMPLSAISLRNEWN